VAGIPKEEMLNTGLGGSGHPFCRRTPWNGREGRGTHINAGISKQKRRGLGGGWSWARRKWIHKSTPDGPKRAVDDGRLGVLTKLLIQPLTLTQTNGKECGAWLTGGGPRARAWPKEQRLVIITHTGRQND